MQASAIPHSSIGQVCQECRECTAPAEPPTLSSAVPDWREGDTIHLGKRAMRVVGKRDHAADQAPMLIVEDA